MSKTQPTALRRVRGPVAAMAAVLAGVAAVPALAQQPIVLKMGTQTQNDVQHEYMKVFKSKVEAAANNRIRVELYPASQLGPFPQQISGLRLGNIQSLVGPFEFYVGIDPSFQVTSMAGLWKDNDHIRRVADKPEFRKIMQDVGEKRDITVGGIIAYDMQHFAFKQPVATLADFKGRRVRVLASEAEQAAVQALGSASIPMPLPEVLPALQQGTIDGVSSGFTIFTTLRYFDAAPHIAETKLWALVTAILFSKSWLDGLPADLKKIILDTAKGIETENHEWNRGTVKAAYEIWQKNNGKIVKLPAADQADAQKRVIEATNKVLEKHPAVKATYEAVKKIADSTN